MAKPKTPGIPDSQTHVKFLKINKMKKAIIFSVFAVAALMTASCTEDGLVSSGNNVPGLQADGGPGHTPVPPPPPPPPKDCLTCP
ncbi:hypothetical protein [Flavobacterium sp.]|uniref:hypothetical protein n=1 Tax=Flavobacterium sp. TaxID=239 RepID=UPI00260DD095|nr:hypothetical protein [Flavobacterium sp.]